MASSWGIGVIDKGVGGLYNSRQLFQVARKGMESTWTLLERSRALVNGGESGRDEIALALSPAGFVDPQAAFRRLQRIARNAPRDDALGDALAHLLSTLSSAANPDRVLISLDRFLGSARGGKGMLRYLAGTPRAVEILVTLFAGSQFLTEILLRNPEYLRHAGRPQELAQPKSLEQFCIEAEAAVAACIGSPAKSSTPYAAFSAGSCCASAPATCSGLSTSRP